jgi:general secretion pathway protein G
MKRKYGFTLVELLIVLAVIAALIATITPLALNAIRRARASQVAQNFRTLASALENAAYVNGVFSAALVVGGETVASAGEIKNAAGDGPVSFAEIGRNIDAEAYNVIYEADGGTYTVWVFAIANADPIAVQEVFSEVEDSDAYTGTIPEPAAASGIFQITGGSIAHDSTDIDFVYEFEFRVY